MKTKTVQFCDDVSGKNVIIFVEERPNNDPKVWLAAKRYPVAEPWPRGKTTSEEYAISIEVIGIVENPTKIPKVPVCQVLVIFKRLTWVMENMKKLKNKPMINIFLYCKVCFTLFMKNIDPIIPEIEAETVIMAVVEDGFLYLRCVRAWSRLGIYDIMTPWLKAIMSIILIYSLFPKSYFKAKQYPWLFFWEFAADLLGGVFGRFRSPRDIMMNTEVITTAYMVRNFSKVYLIAFWSSCGTRPRIIPGRAPPRVIEKRLASTAMEIIPGTA